MKKITKTTTTYEYDSDGKIVRKIEEVVIENEDYNYPWSSSNLIDPFQYSPVIYSTEFSNSTSDLHKYHE